MDSRHAQILKIQMSFRFRDLTLFSAYPRFYKPVKASIGIFYTNMDMLFIHLVHLETFRYRPKISHQLRN